MNGGKRCIPKWKLNPISTNRSEIARKRPSKSTNIVPLRRLLKIRNIEPDQLAQFNASDIISFVDKIQLPGPPGFEIRKSISFHRCI